MRLIDADAFEIELQHEWENNEISNGEWMDIRQWLKEAPTIEAEPVRHGKWMIKAVNTFELAYGTTGYEPVYQCSVCGGVEESYLRLDEPIMPEDADFPKYCPHCGAKMEGVKNEDDRG